jgi:Protein of unknown function (DUF2470)
VPLDPDPAHHRAPSAAERVRSICARGLPATLAIDGAAPAATPIHQLLDDGSYAVIVPTGTAAAAAIMNAGSASIQAVLECTDYAPLPVRKPVRSLLWVRGAIRSVTRPPAVDLLDLIAARGADPALLPGDLGDADDAMYLLGSMEIASAVLADCTGAESVVVDALLAARPDPFCTMESSWLQHLYAEHGDVVDRLASKLPARLRRGRLYPVGIDRYGLSLRVEGDHSDHDVRLAFATPVDDVTGLSQAIRVLMGCPFLNGLRSRQASTATATAPPFLPIGCAGGCGPAYPG